MNVILRQAAILQELSHYYTGLPCINGHLSVRRTKDRKCLSCDKDATKDYKRRNASKVQVYDNKRPRRQSDPQKKKLADKKWRTTLRLKVMDFLGGRKCGNCGCDVLSILDINHVKGGGRSHRKTEHFSTIWSKILSGKLPKQDFNVLCKVCNTQHYITEILGTKGHKVTWNSVDN